MIKFSVKKPLTVLVAVVIILVLGFVSFSNMTPDLLPSIELPYVVLITTYPGATPERVETAVTRPLEQSMATLENMENMSSTSSENVSIIMLEFSSETNMQAITVDILQKISQVEGGWDDAVGTPLILKLNPDMLPVMVAAVEMEGMDTANLSDFVEKTVLNKLQGVSGVANVNASGLVEETLNAVLRQEKIDAKNSEIARAINTQFSDKEQELLNTQSDLKSKLATVQSSMKQLEKGIDELAAKSGAGGAEINSKQMELLQGKLAITSQIAELTQQLNDIIETEKIIMPFYNTVLQLEEEQKRAAAAVAQINADITWLQGENARILQITADVQNNTPGWAAMTPEQQQAAVEHSPDYVKLMQERAAIQARYPNSNPVTAADLAPVLAQEQANLTKAEGGLQLVANQLAQPPLSTDIAGLKALVQQLAAGKAALQDGIGQLEDALNQLESGQLALSDALAQLEQVKIKTQYQLISGSMQLNSAQGQLTSGLAQLEQGLEQLNDARDNALEQANINKMLSMDRLTALLSAQNFSMPAGYVHEDGAKYMVRVEGAVRSLEELQNLVLVDLNIDGVAPILLSDVADVFISDNLDTLYAKINGNDGVLLSFNKQNTYATADVSERINAEFEALSKEYPGLKFTPLMDQGDYIHIVVNSILQNLALGAVFAIIILFLFLKDLRPTFITLCSIPLSVMFAVVLMYFSGITLNIISLSGLAVAVGMLVDNSVVVIENIFRLRKIGFTAAQAAVAGAKQVAGAITSSTLTTVCVFLPIVFVQGITRQLFTDMALTLGYALMASLLVALTLVPAMASGMFKAMQPKENKLLTYILGAYRQALDWALRRKAVVLLSAVALLVLSIGLVLIRGFIFMPPSEPTQITITISMPDKSSTFEQLCAASDEVNVLLADIDGIETVGSMASSGNTMVLEMGGGTDADSTSMYVMVKPGKGYAVEAEIRQRIENLPYTVNISNASQMDMSALSSGDIVINVYGNDTAELFSAARSIAAKLEQLPGTKDVDDGIGETDPEISFVVNRQRAMEHGLTVAQVYSEVSKALRTETESTTVTWDGRDYGVMIVSGEQTDLTPGFIKDLSFTVTGQDGQEKEVFLHEVADVKNTETAVSISRSDQRRYIQVTAGVADGSNVTLVTGEAEQALSNLTFPSTVTYEFDGQNETIMTSFRDLSQMLLLGILLVYLIMVMQFQSLKSPFIVMFTVPLAFTGGFLGLLITGFELSVVALIGFVMLVGIIVNNGIVLVDYINQLRIEGKDRIEAVIEAGITRMRPVLMTSLTTILGLIVMAIGVGTGSEMMQPVAIVCIGGLVYATFMTLFVVPIMYDIFNKKDMRVVRDADIAVDMDALPPETTQE